MIVTCQTDSKQQRTLELSSDTKTVMTPNGVTWNESVKYVLLNGFSHPLAGYQ